MKPSEYIQYDAMGLAELVRNKEVTAMELLDVSLDIAKKMQPKIGALCNLEEEAARSRIREGLPKGIFSGVPFVLKDIKAEASDIPMSSGSRFFTGMRHEKDNELVTRYRNSGLVIYGRSTTAELALDLATEAHRAYGYDTRNPWDPKLSPGGSSGGAAACVAAGVMPMAHATDGAGSIRGPAALCGLVGLKPTKGLLPAGPYIGEMWAGLLTDGVVSRSVRDTAGAMEICCGADAGAPYAAPDVGSSFLEAISKPPRRLKIACMKDLFGAKADPEVSKAVTDAANFCSELGHFVTEDRPRFDMDELWYCFQVIMIVSTTMEIQKRTEMLDRLPGEEDLEAPTLQLAALGEKISATEYVACIAAMNRIVRNVSSFFADYDILIAPVMAKPEQPMGMSAKNPAVYTRESIHHAPPQSMLLANATGQPAISLPLVSRENGLPVGVQFYGRFGEDAELLSLAAELERSRPWFDKIPKMTKML